jgi:phage shock protein PspC (stress-responsive transcriptional regulator)
MANNCARIRQGGPVLHTDTTLIRVLLVMLALLGGPGLVIYLVLWLVVPRSATT